MLTDTGCNYFSLLINLLTIFLINELIVKSIKEVEAITTSQNPLTL